MHLEHRHARLGYEGRPTLGDAALTAAVPEGEDHDVGERSGLDRDHLVRVRVRVKS